MQREEPGRGDPIGPLDWRQILPFEAAAASDQLAWVGLEAARCRAEPAFELSVPAITHHRLVLVTRPPVDLDLRYEGVKRHRPTHPSWPLAAAASNGRIWRQSRGPIGSPRPDSSCCMTFFPQDKSGRRNQLIVRISAGPAARRGTRWPSS